jgi:hypothetical protein
MMTSQERSILWRAGAYIAIVMLIWLNVSLAHAAVVLEDGVHTMYRSGVPQTPTYPTYWWCRNALEKRAAAEPRTYGAITWACRQNVVARYSPNPPPSLDAVLSWDAPTKNTDESPLTDITGYRIVYGNDEDDLTKSVEVPASVRTHTLTGLEVGSWYFAVVTLTGTAESQRSSVVSKVIQ